VALASASSQAAPSGGIPEETAGPFPGDGTNGPNVLAESGVVRSDITMSDDDAARSPSRRSSRPPYEQSVANLAQTSLDTDMVFSDGYAGQLATVSGSVESGLAVRLNVGV
jgi:hypothetical protein